MNTAVINIKTNPETKLKAQKVASELGFSLSSIVNGYLKQLVKTKTICFSLHTEKPSQYLIQALEESEKDRKRGHFKSFTSADKTLGFVDNFINEAKKK